MTERRYSITVDASDEVERLLALFERERSFGPVDLSDFAPTKGDPSHDAVVTELARIDLEHASEEGSMPDGTCYVEQFPAVFEDRERKGQLAFEEYRLRRRGGENISSVEICRKYQLENVEWPELPVGQRQDSSTNGFRRSKKSNLNQLPIRFPEIGESIAGYRLVTLLGEGASSRVFVARQPDLASRLVVLKVTPYSTSESDRLASLQHSSIIPIFSVHSEGNLSCICMPFLGATTLADFCVSPARSTSSHDSAQELISTIRSRRQSTIQSIRESPYAGRSLDDSADNNEPDRSAPSRSNASRGPEQDLSQFRGIGYVGAIIKIVIGAVDGLAYAHCRDVIHRDLKPANILLTDDGNPVLLDFNLAVSAHDSETNIVGGTLPYMSPQQLESLQTGETADKRDDVFAVGVILYELLAGQLPFKCPERGQPIELACVIADRRTSPPPIRTLNAGVSRGLEGIIARCLAPERGDRYADASELLEDLQRHENHLPLKYASDRAISERIAKWSARHPRISSATSIGSLAAILLILMGFLFWQRGERLATMDARTTYQAFHESLPEALLKLSTPGYEPEILEDGLRQSKALLQQWQSDAEPWKVSEQAGYLDSESREELRHKLGKLAYETANAEFHLARQSAESERRSLLADARDWNRRACGFDPQLRALSVYQLKRLNAESTIGTALDEANPSPASLDILALHARETGDALRWRQLTEQQLAGEPTNVTHWVNLALADNRLGNLDSAAMSFKMAMRLLPRSNAIRLNHGICQLDREQWDEAIEDFTICLDADPNQMVPRFNRALAFHRLNRQDRALSDLNYLVDHGHKRIRILNLRAQVNHALGRQAAREADARLALETAPQDTDDWVARGVLHLRSSAVDALADFQTALQLAPENVTALNNLAHVHAERLHDAQRGIEMLTRLLELRPNSASAHASRGILFARLGDIDSALRDAMRAADQKPTALERLQIAGIYAMASQSSDDNSLRDIAFRWLSQSLQLDAGLASVARTDPDLNNLRDDTRFEQLVTSAQTLSSDL